MHTDSYLLRPSTGSDSLKSRRSSCVTIGAFCKDCNHAESMRRRYLGRIDRNNVRFAQKGQMNADSFCQEEVLPSSSDNMPVGISLLSDYYFCKKPPAALALRCHFLPSDIIKIQSGAGWRHPTRCTYLKSLQAIWVQRSFAAKTTFGNVDHSSSLHTSFSQSIGMTVMYSQHPVSTTLAAFQVHLPFFLIRQ